MNDLLKAADMMHPDSYVLVNRQVVDRLCLLERAAEVAAKAAPYLHPRLQAIEHSGKDGGPIHHEATLNVTLSAEESYHRMLRVNGDDQSPWP